MSAAASAWAWRQKKLPSTSKIVLLAIANYADDQNCSAVSRERVMELTGLSDTTVRRAVSEMTKAGLLKEVDEVIRKEAPAGPSRLVPRYLVGFTEVALP